MTPARTAAALKFVVRAAENCSNGTATLRGPCVMSCQAGESHLPP
jgi:hypothetical protein